MEKQSRNAQPEGGVHPSAKIWREFSRWVIYYGIDARLAACYVHDVQ
jgi:hypothetical protein